RGVRVGNATRCGGPERGIAFSCGKVGVCSFRREPNCRAGEETGRLLRRERRPCRSRGPPRRSEEMLTRTLVCGAAVLLAGPASVATAQVLQFDVNSISYTILNEAGMPDEFTGEMHSGAVELSLGAGRLPAVHIQEDPPFGPFALQTGFMGTLFDFDARFDLENGDVIGGSLRLELDSGDVYMADVDAIGS